MNYLIIEKGNDDINLRVAVENHERKNKILNELRNSQSHE